jgi:hypothetical protein
MIAQVTSVPRLSDALASLGGRFVRADPLLLRRVAETFGPVFPIDLRDRDLRVFTTVLYRLVRYLRPRAIVQVGTAVGTSTVAMGLALRDNGSGILHTIDPEPAAYFGFKQPVDVARRVIRRVELDHQTRFVRGYSTCPSPGLAESPAATPAWRLRAMRGSVEADLLVVDGDHSAFGCYLDLHYGAQVLANSGPRIILCHDYLGIREVRIAVDAWVRRNPVLVNSTIRSPCGIKLLQLPVVEQIRGDANQERKVR